MREYGITTSIAAVWVHVCPLDAALYYYSRLRMLAILPKLKQREIATAIGVLCPLYGNRACDGGFIEHIDPPWEWWKDYNWEAITKDEAGAHAENLFMRCVERRLFKIPAKATRYETRQEQYSGRDFKITPAFASFDVEVKADMIGGEWGTKNLFVQTHEKRAPQEL